MRGDLSETSAADACRDLAGDGVTGVLWLDGPYGPGSVTFVDGRIVGATSPTPRARLGDRLVGAGFLADEALAEALETQQASSGRSRLGALLVERTLVPRDAIRLFVQEQTLDAMFEVLRWRFGSFSFEPGEAAAVPEVPVAMSVDQALVEVARRHQQWRELSQVIPDLEAVPAFSSDPATAVASLEPDEFAVLASVDGERSVRTLAADLGYGEFELARIVYGLVLLGVVEIELPEDEIGAALDDAMTYPGHVDPASAAGEPESPAPEVTVEPAAEVELETGRASERDTGAEPEPEVVAGSAAEPEVVTGSAAEPEVVTGTEPEAEPVAEPDAEPVAEPDAGEAAPSDVEGTVIETELPERTYSDVFRELRGLDGATPAAEATAAAGAPGPSARPDDPAPVPTPTASGGEDREPPRRAARSADDGDVSEFLRELSRLAIDEQQAEPERPRRTPPPASDPKDDDSKRKRRGLFGRG